VKVTLDIDLPDEKVRAALNRALEVLSPIDDELLDEVTMAMLFACEHLPLGELRLAD
jgi:hypothetical protein